jgi:uncharacterized phage protein (TIGR02218 family)
MTYLGRPVFEFPVNWAAAPPRSFRYDLRPLTLGFGGPRFAPLQSHVVRGWELELVLDGAAAIAAFDTFTAALKGRLNGFWLPTPEAAMVIAAAVSTTQFDIQAQGLADAWSAHPAKYLWLAKDGAQHQPAQISNVTDLGNGRERVTLTAALAAAPDATWQVNGLAYVRLADDTEEGEFLAEGVMRRTLKVVELTTEYAEIETGQQPVWLYHFWADYGGTLVHWRFTSYPDTLTAAGQTWTARPITHGALRQTLKADREEVTIETVHESGNPLAQFLPFTLARPLWVEILMADFSDLATADVLFTGLVGAPEFTGRKITAKASSLLDALGQQLPPMLIQQKCNYRWGDPRTCRVDPDDWKIEAVITAIEGNLVTVEDAALTGVAANYFARGWLKVGAGATLEVRDILQSTPDGDRATLALSWPLAHAAVDDEVTLYPGCEHTPAACDDFDNFVNYGGHIVPQTSLSVRAFKKGGGGGGKK